MGTDTTRTSGVALLAALATLAMGACGGANDGGGGTNVPPVASAGPDQAVATGAVVTLDGSGSSDADGDALTYAWSMTSKPGGSAATLSSATAAAPTFTADVEGTYVLSLTVHDGTVASAADEVTITATTPNAAPVANAGPDQAVATGAVVTLDGSGSSDADGDALTYAWSMTSKPGGSAAALSSATAVGPTFTADVEGTYVLSLTVHDGTVASAADEVTVTATTPLPTTFRISGTVGGAIAAGVTISLAGPSGGTTTTDGSGYYAFAGLANGSYVVRPTLAGYAFSPTSIDVTVDGADVPGQDFTALAKIYAISGTVTGASSVTVALSGTATASTTTDASGAFTFTALTNGAYTVTPSKTGYSFSPASLSPTVSFGSVTGQDFSATPLPWVISGNVSGATSVAMYLTGTASRSTTTEASGDYLFPGLANGAYTVTPYKDSLFTFLPLSRGVTVESAAQPGQDFAAVDATWANWAVPAVSPADSDYTVNVDTVLDNVTGLLWQRTATATRDWANAKTYCRTLSLGGHATGWRLPTLIELESLVDYGTSNPAINATAFPGTAADYFWTSVPYVNNVSFAFMVSFGEGYLGGGIKSTSRLVRCVR